MQIREEGKLMIYIAKGLSPELVLILMWWCVMMMMMTFILIGLFFNGKVW